jgi:hypothetical protein
MHLMSSSAPVRREMAQTCETPPARFPEVYRDILAWSPDAYHRDSDDA